MRHYCTYFDGNFLVRGLTLYESLLRHGREFTLYILCFDDTAYDFFEKRSLAHVVPVSLVDLEKDDPELKATKPTRSKVEYMFTCSPSLPAYLLKAHPEIDIITYLDADLFFFSSPEPIFREFGSNSILIIGHRFSEKNRHGERAGKFNVAFVSFRNDGVGGRCLQWWRERCIEWCYDREEDGRFADQKYLDHWPELFEGVHVLQHKGANLAPWNVDNYVYRRRGSALLVDDDELIFYHFHGLNRLWRSLYRTSVASEDLRHVLISMVYEPYIREMDRVRAQYGLSSDGRNRFLTGSTPRAIINAGRAGDLVYCGRSLPAFNLGRVLQLPALAYLRFRRGRCQGYQGE